MGLVLPAMPEIGPKTRRAGCRFRPPLRRTFGFRLLPTGEASSYSRPVLGASGTLGVRAISVQVVAVLFRAKSDVFFFLLLGGLTKQALSRRKRPGRRA